METLYARTRREGIRHGGPMTCEGELYRSGGALLASLRLHPSGTAHEDGFHFHPGKADASTLVAFGQNEEVGEEPFIPFHIGWFRAPEPVGETFHVHVAHPEVASGSGDLVRNGYTIHDERGRLLAEFRDMSCKRIRHPELITRLLEEVETPRTGRVQDTEAEGSGGAPAPGTDGAALSVATARLVELVGAELGRPAAEVAPDTGFYDLGLDSVALLRIGERLEELVGATLYPTLLFEYGSVGALAHHLAQTYPGALTAAGRRDRRHRAGRHRPGEPPGGDRGRHLEDHRLPDRRMDRGPAPCRGRSPAGRTGGARRGPGRRSRRRAVRGGRRGGHRPPGGRRGTRYGVRPARLRRVPARPHGPGALRRLLADLAAEGVRPAGYVLRPGDRPAAELWALCAALVDARPVAPTPVLVRTVFPAPPEHAALAALASTVTAEVPALRCRLVETERDAPAAPAVVESELADLAAPAPDGPTDALGAARRGPPAGAPLGGDGTGPRRSRQRVHGRWGLPDHRRRRRSRGSAGRAPGHRPPGAPDAGGPASGGRGRLHGAHGRLARAGRRVRYVAADVSTRAGAEAAAAPPRRAFGRIDGVLHCAGTVRDGLFFRKRPDDLAAVCAAKVDGTIHLDAATADDGLGLFVLFSSLSGVLANPGQADYAYANAFQFHFAEHRAAARAGRSLAVAWPLWEDGGMRATTMPYGVHRTDRDGAAARRGRARSAAAGRTRRAQRSRGAARRCRPGPRAAPRPRGRRTRAPARARASARARGRGCLGRGPPPR